MAVDESKLKKRPAYPFENIAIGLSFKKQNDWIVNEARRLSEMCNAKLFFIHVGAKTAQKEKELEDIIFRTNVEEKKVQMIWVDGDVVDALLKVCKLNIIDLLVLGAIEKESMLKHFVGSIARKVSRKAKCSVLLLVKEMNTFSPSRKVLVSAPPDHAKTSHTLNTTAYYCKLSGIKEVSVVSELHAPVMAMALAENSNAPEIINYKKKFIEDEVSGLHKLIAQSDLAKMKIKERAVKGMPGYAVRKYAASRKYDLLFINSPDKYLSFFDRLFPHDAEFLLQELPCNLLIVHSRV